MGLWVCSFCVEELPGRIDFRHLPSALVGIGFSYSIDWPSHGRYAESGLFER